MGQRHILHCDCNSFYASVEMQEHPELRGKSIAVCGDPEARHGIVLTASYPAKRMGVKTAMPIWEAKQHCRDLIVVSSSYGKYQKYSSYDVCRFEFLSAFEILTVDFSPQFRYAVLALSVSFCTVNVKAKDQSCKAFWLNDSGLFVGACATAPFLIHLRLSRKPRPILQARLRIHLRQDSSVSARLDGRRIFTLKIFPSI